MKIRLTFLMITALFSSVLFFTACEEDDPCEGVVCEFDGNCVEGTCECTEITLAYLVGTWKDSLGGTYSFESSGAWTTDASGGGSGTTTTVDVRADGSYAISLLNGSGDITDIFLPSTTPGSVTCNSFEAFITYTRQ